MRARVTGITIIVHYKIVINRHNIYDVTTEPVDAFIYGRPVKYFRPGLCAYISLYFIVYAREQWSVSNNTFQTFFSLQKYIPEFMGGHSGGSAYTIIVLVNVLQ